MRLDERFEVRLSLASRSIAQFKGKRALRRLPFVGDTVCCDLPRNAKSRAWMVYPVAF